MNPGDEWKDASLHLLKSIPLRTPLLQGTRGLMSWSGRTMAYTWHREEEGDRVSREKINATSVKFPAVRAAKINCTFCRCVHK